MEMTPEELHNVYRAENEFWWYQGMRAITAALMDPLFSNRGGVGLDAGCGTGFNALEFERRHGLRMFGVDLATDGIRYSRQMHLARSAVASITALPFPEGAFDLVSSFDVLCMLPSGAEGKALQEFARVLRPGGWMVLRVPAFHALRSRHSQFILEQQRFVAGQLTPILAKLNLRMTYLGYANSLLSPIALIKFRIWEPLTRAQPQSGVGELPPAWLNRLLRSVLRCEAALIRRGCRFLFGQSLFVVAQKPASSHNS